MDVPDARGGLRGVHRAGNSRARTSPRGGFIAARFAFCPDPRRCISRATLCRAQPRPCSRTVWDGSSCTWAICWGVVTLVLVESGMAARGVLARPGGGRCPSRALLVGAPCSCSATAARSRSARATGWRAARCRFEAVDAGGRGCGRRERRRSCIRARACSRYRRADRPHPRACRNAAASPCARPGCSTSWRAADRYRYVRDALVISRDGRHPRQARPRQTRRALRQRLIDLVH